LRGTAHGLFQGQVDHLTDKSLKVGFVAQGAIDARRRHLKPTVFNAVHFQRILQLSGDFFAIFNLNEPFGLTRLPGPIDGHTQQATGEAFVKSGQILAAGIQDLSKQAAATARGQFDETVSAFKALTAVKSFKDVFELQTGFARAAFEKTMAESSRLTDASLKLSEEAWAPIGARVGTVVESFSKAA